MQKVYDIVSKVGEYQDRQTGETKAQWKNVGAVMKGEKGAFIMLDRTFNPAGLPNPEDRSSCLLSLFEPKQQQGAPQQQPAQQPPQQPQGASGGYDEFADSEIPF